MTTYDYEAMYREARSRMKSVYDSLAKIQKTTQDTLKDFEDAEKKRPLTVEEKISSSRYRGILWHDGEVKKLLDKVGL